MLSTVQKVVERQGIAPRVLVALYRSPHIEIGALTLGYPIPRKIAFLALLAGQVVHVAFTATWESCQR